MKKLKIQVPFSVNAFQHYPNKWSGEKIYWTVENPVFSGRLRFDSIERGQSAAYFHVTVLSASPSSVPTEDGVAIELLGTQVAMFMTDILDVLKSKLIQNGEVSGTWTFQKRGQNYGLRMVKDGEQ